MGCAWLRSADSLPNISDLTIALAGGVVGAVAAGGVQALQHERQRRLAGRVSARLLYGDLARAEHDVHEVLRYGRWPLSGRPSFDETLRAWEMHRVALAAAATGSDWTLIALSYSDLADFIHLPDPKGPLRDDILDQLRRVCVRLGVGTDTLAKYVAPRWERRRIIQNLSREAEPIPPEDSAPPT